MSSAASFTCDRCGATSPAVVNNAFLFGHRCEMPKGWGQVRRSDLCANCLEAVDALLEAKP